MGKSTLAQDFADSTGRHVLRVNFWKDPKGQLARIFVKNATAQEIIRQLEPRNFGTSNHVLALPIYFTEKIGELANLQ